MIPVHVLTRLRRNATAICLFTSLLLQPAESNGAAPLHAAWGFFPPASSMEAIGDLVFTGGSRPLRVRIVVERDGMSLSEMHEYWQQTYFEGLLAQLDSNADGVLSKSEATRLPPPPPPLSVLMRQRADEIFVAQGSGGADKNEDDVIELSELRQFYQTHDESLVRLTTIAAPAGGDPLFGRLDEDRNRRLSSAEWEAASDLMQFDRDGNGILTTGEVTRPVANTAQEFVAAPSGSMSSTSLRCEFESLANGPYDLVVVVSQSTVDGELSQTDLSLLTPANSTVQVEPGARRGDDGVVSLSFRFEGHLVQLHILPPAIRGLEQTQETLRREFIASDLDEDGRVPNTTDVPEFLAETFGLLDHDGSGEVDREEIDGYLHGLLVTRAQLESTRMIMQIHEETRGLFSLCDRNGDGRLSQRETGEIANQWSMLAGRADELRASDIPRSTQIVLRPGSLASPYHSTGPTDLGPPWFFRMDRNRDGDVDVAEFLGESHLFNGIDTNGDALISAGEAIAADREMRQD